MVIEKIEIRRFGKLAGVDMSFSPSFNLIEGPNESGKTTLASFIFYMLYGFGENEKGKELCERVLRAPWDGEDISGRMTVAFDGERYLIERTSVLTEKGMRDSYALTNLQTGEKREGGKSAGELFLGVSREVFESTAFFSAENYRVDEEGVTEAIENIIFSGSEKFSLVRALMQLEETRTQLVTPGGKSGALVSLAKEKDELSARLASAKERERELIKKENLLFTTKEKKKECERELAKFHRLETDYHNAMMIRDYDRLHELEDAVAEKNVAIKAYEDEHRTGSFLPSVAYLTELSAAKTQLEGAHHKLASAKEELERTQKEGAPVSEEQLAMLSRIRGGGEENAVREAALGGMNRAKKQTAAFVVSFSLSLAFLVLCILSLVWSKTGLALAFAALCLVGIGAGVVSLLEFLRTHKSLLALYDLGCAHNYEEFEKALWDAAETQRKKNEYDAHLSDRELFFRQCESDYGAKIKVMEGVLHRVRPSLVLDDGYEAVTEEVYREVEAYLECAKELYREKDAAEAEVRALRAHLSGQNEIAVRALVPPDRRAALCNHNATDLRHGVEHYEKMLESFSRKADTIEEELSRMKHGEGSAEVAEHIMALDARMRAMRERASLYGSAEDKLRGSFARLRDEISPRLSLYACGLLSELTEGKYTELKIGEDLSLAFVCEEGEKSVAYLSRGTKEMTYLALRMALLDLLYERTPPVCLDECFAHQDEERAAAFMRALESLSASGMQCFLFTSHEREKRLADRVFGSYRRITMTP